MEQLSSILGALTEGNRPILLGLWVCGHCLIIFTFVTKTRKLTFFLMAVMLLTLYCLKPPTYDLEKYSVFYDTGYITHAGSEILVTDKGVTLDPLDTTGDPYRFGEVNFTNIGFSQLMRSMSQLLPAGMYLPRLSLPEYESWFVADSMVLGIIVLTFILLQFCIFNLLKETTSFYVIAKPVLLITTPIIIGSIFFLLGSQNTIRQFLAVTLTIVSLTCYVRKWYLLAVIFIVVANMFHHWGWVFGLGLTMFLFGNKIVELINARIKQPDLMRIEYCALIGGIIATLMVSIIIRLPTMTGYLSETTNPLILWFLDHTYGDILIYASRWDVTANLERVTIEYKIVLIGLLLLISELLAGKAPDTVRIPIRSLRRSIFLFLVPLSFHPEILSRLLFFYFCIEMICLVSMICGESLRSRAAGALVFCSYAIAPNSINIIIGGSWRYALG